MHSGRHENGTTAPHPTIPLAARVVVAALLAVGALTITPGDARAVPLEGNNDRGISAVTSSGTRYITAALAPATGRHTARGGEQER